LILALALAAVFSLDPGQITASQRGQRGHDSEEQIRAEWLKGVGRLEEPLKNIACQAHGTISGYSDEEYSYRFSARYLVKGDSRLVIYHYDPKHPRPRYGASSVYCLTPSWVFELGQGFAGGPYFIRAYEPDLSRASRRFVRADARMKRELDVYVFAAVSICDIPVRELLADPGVKITAIKRPSEGEPGAVEVSFEFTDPNSSPNYKSGVAVLKPSLDWAISRYEIVLRSQPGVRETISGTVLCQRWGPTEFVFPKKVERADETTTPDGKRYWRTAQVEFEDVALRQVSDSDFTLGAFGLPELPGPMRCFYPFDSLLFWLLVLMAVASGMVLWRKYRKEA